MLSRIIEENLLSTGSLLKQIMLKKYGKEMNFTLRMDGYNRDTNKYEVILFVYSFENHSRKYEYVKVYLLDYLEENKADIVENIYNYYYPKNTGKYDSIIEKALQ